MCQCACLVGGLTHLRASVASAFMLVLVSATVSSAQGPATRERLSLRLSVLGVASIHPVDNTLVGWPYLDRGLGGVGPGATLMVDFVAPTGPTVVFEVSAAAVDVFQTGRLVDGRDAGVGGATGRLRDAMASILGGFTFGTAATTGLSLVGGVAYVDPVPAQGGQRIDRFDDPAVKEGAGRVALVGGFHTRRPLGGRMSLVASARYALLPRSRRAQELGVSRHVIRLGLGLSVRVSE
jgi:hypothetical protein